MSFFSSSSAAASTGASSASSQGNNEPSTTTASSSLTSTERHDNTPHYHFIHSMILPSTAKIQKEMRGRKFRVRCISFSCSVLYCTLSTVIVELTGHELNLVLV
jgi:hypothetical protein